MKTATIISTCRYRLSEEEFVRPIKELAKEGGYMIEVRSYRESILPRGEAVIISGTALMDFDYLNHVDKFEWIKEFNGGIFGICAGAQIIASVYGCGLIDRKIIGVYHVKLVENSIRAYFLTSKISMLSEGFEVLGRLNDIPVYFKVRGREIYGALFHPEVLNRDLLTSFLQHTFKPGTPHI